MAAWKARIDSIAATGETGMLVGVSYYAATDTTFSTQLYAKQIAVACGAVQADVVQEIRTVGVRARLAQDTAAALQPNVGVTINIP